MTLQRQEELKKELVVANAEALSAVKAYKKMPQFAQIAENYYLAKLMKIYGDLVTHIQGVPPNFPVHQVQGLQALLKWKNRTRRQRLVKKMGKPVTPKADQTEAAQPEVSHDQSGSNNSLEDDDAEVTP